MFTCSQNMFYWDICVHMLTSSHTHIIYYNTHTHTQYWCNSLILQDTARYTHKALRRGVVFTCSQRTRVCTRHASRVSQVFMLTSSHKVQYCTILMVAILLSICVDMYVTSSHKRWSFMVLCVHMLTNSHKILYCIKCSLTHKCTASQSAVFTCSQAHTECTVCSHVHKLTQNVL